ncbi:MAG: hypothetical protein KatS3mg111_2614 [Pirellulaceae bacterium]|nr:MAG: hypothetical protein KatS3mg111_2614 [Pirellulaceae bacterium]
MQQNIDQEESNDGDVGGHSVAVIRRPGWRRRGLFIAVAILLGASLGVLIAEAALRIYVAARGWTPNCYATGISFFVPHPQAGYMLRPGLRVRSSTYDITVNSRGLRGPEIPSAKSPDVVRILVVGGSAVFGYLVPDAQDPCRMLEACLRERGHRVEVINAGVPGYNVTQCRARLQADLAPLRPDVVLVYSGWNDIPWLIAGAAPLHRRVTPAPPWWKRALVHSTLYGFLRYRLFPPAEPVFTPPPAPGTRITEAGAAVFEREYRELVRGIRQLGAIPVVSEQLTAACSGCSDVERFLGASPEQVETNRRLGQWVQQAVRRIAEEEGAESVAVCGVVTCDGTTLGDAIHPTAVGYQAIVARWCEALEPLLLQRRSSLGQTSSRNRAVEHAGGSREADEGDRSDPVAETDG